MTLTKTDTGWQQQLLQDPSFKADVVEEARRLRQQQREQDNPAYRRFQQKYRYDFAAFVADCVTWREDEAGFAPYQEEIARELVEQRRVSVRGPHGLGKTALAALAVLWFALTRDGEDWKVPTTASAWRQLTKFLWPEIHKWSRRLRWQKIGRSPFDERTELLSLSLKLETGEAFAAASSDSHLIEGAHADNLLYVFDEAKAISGDIFDAAEGAFSGAGEDTGNEAYALAISTPGEPQGRFYEIHKRQAGYEDWWTRHVRLEETIRAGRVSRAWAEQRKRQWGEKSAVYQNRVEGEFATSDEDGVIPLAHVELANQRWHELNDSGEWGAFKAVGADVGRGGDPSVMALRFETAIRELRRDNKKDTMSVAGRVKGVLDRYGGRAVVDVIGIGAGVVDRLREQGLRGVVAFNAGAKTNRKDESGELGFVDKRSAAWWNMRELLDPANGHAVALPPDDKLTGDLTAPRWRTMSGGRIRVESKEDIRKRLKRSTDDGDAVIQAFWDDDAPQDPPPPPADMTQQSKWR